jgi:hypothetical protein
MSDFVAIDIKGLPELQAKFDKMLPAVQDAIVDEIAPYLVNVLQNEQPTPNHGITRKQAYGVTFFTKKQRRWFFWALNSGRLQLPYHRTQATRRGWRIIGKGSNAIIANETAGALFTRDDERQSRHEALVGWQKIGAMLKDKSKEIMRRADAGARKGIKKAGLS